MRGEMLGEQSVRLDRSHYYFLGVLTLVNTLNYLDRNVINILAESIKRDLVLEDWQLGALSGLAFALLYSAALIPFARLAERVDRPRMLGGAIVVWSGFTMACGAAQNFAQLAVLRAGVGLGESAGSPAAQSLVVDAMPRQRRAWGMGVYASGMSLGSLFGMALGGLLADGLGWQMAFVVAGAPGVVIGIALALTLKDPRRIPGLAPTAQRRPIPFREAFRELSRRRSFPLIALGTTASALVGAVHGAFFAAFVQRVHPAQLEALASSTSAALGFTIGPIGFLGVTLGLAFGIAGVAGAAAGGWFTDRYAMKHGHGAYMMVPAVSKVIALPLGILALLMGDLVLAILLSTLAQFTRSLSHGAALSSVHGLVRPEMRPTTSAVMIVILTLFAAGVGPTLIGALSSGLKTSGLGDADGLRVALIVAEGFSLLAAALFLWARPIFAKEVIS